MAGEERRSDGFTAVEDRYSGYTVYDQGYEKVGKVDDIFIDENDTPEYLGVKMGFLGTKSTLVPFEMVRVNDERRVVEIASDKESVKNGPAFDEDREITPDFEREVRAHYKLDKSSASSGERGGYGDYYSDQSREGEDVDLRYGERQEGSRADDAAVAGAATGATASGNTSERDGDVYDQNEDFRATGDDDRSRDREARNVGASMSENEGGTGRTGSDLEDKDELRASRSEGELRAGTRERESGKTRVRKRVRNDRE